MIHVARKPLTVITLSCLLLTGCSSGVDSKGRHNIDVDYVFNQSFNLIKLEPSESIKVDSRLEKIQREVVRKVEEQLDISGVVVLKSYESYGDNHYVFTLRHNDLIFSAKYLRGTITNDYYTSKLSVELNDFIKQDLDLTQVTPAIKDSIIFQLQPIYDDGTQILSKEDVKKRDLKGYLVFDIDPNDLKNYQEQFLRSFWQLRREYRIPKLSIFVTDISKTRIRSDIFSNRVRLDDPIIMTIGGSLSYYIDLNQEGAVLNGLNTYKFDKIEYTVEELDLIKKEPLIFLDKEEGLENETGI